MLATINRGGIQGGGAASSYEVTQEDVLVPISGPMNNTRSDTCWFVVTANDKYGYVANFQSGDLSSYRVEPDGTLIRLQPLAAVLGPPESGPAGQALSINSKFRYVQVVNEGTVAAFKVDQ
ncbi:MAG: hypothetical protein M3R24_32445 [Chloroflexota bacterium]|nr:hypothetical protein [Chloroflexota bacterium]